MTRVRKNTPKAYLPGLLLLALVGVAGCDRGSSGADIEGSGGSPLQVVATTTVLCDLTQQIAQGKIALTCLLEPGQDPHTYKVQPSDRRAIDQADLILDGGYGLIPTISTVVNASRNPAPKIAVYEEAVPAPLLGDGHDHDHDAEHDDTAEHDDPADRVADPHVWHNAMNAAAIAQAIANHLQQVDPTHAEDYQRQTTQLTTQFTEIDRWIQGQMATVPPANRQLITTHNAFQYYAAAYGLEVDGALMGLSTAEKPAAGQLSELADHIQATQVPAIFAEVNSNPQLLENLAQAAGVAVAPQPLYGDGPGAADTPASTTQTMLIANTCAIVEGLGGQCDATDLNLSQR